MVRSYQDSDYQKLKALYQHTEWYGGVFDEARDSQARLAQKIADDSQAILVFEEDSELKGTISIIDDGRVAMLYRFVVPPDEPGVAESLYKKATQTLKNRGHRQILVYSAPDNPELDTRYIELGMTKGGNYTCFWANI